MLAEIRDALERIADAMEQEKTAAPAITRRLQLEHS